MSPLRRAVAGAAVLTAALAPVAHAGGTGSSSGTGSLTEHTFSAPGLPTRTYWLYVPPGPADNKRPLVVFLHGCNTDGLWGAQVTGFDALADARGFVVVYPNQTVSAPSSAPLADGNGVGCWNWFLPEDQSRGAGEPGTIAGITQAVISSENIDADRVYVDGVSAGADLAVILGATYPDLYAAVGAIAGCAYRTCSDETGALTYAAMRPALGQRPRMVPLFVENGSADTLNPLPLAAGLVQSWLGADDLADNGRLDGSVPRTPASVQSYGFDQTPSPGSGDPCIHNDTLTCPGGVIGFQQTYPYTVSSYAARGCEVAQFWVIHGMEHAYPDAPGDAPYTDPLGPDVTTAAYDFFAAHSRNERCGR